MVMINWSSWRRPGWNLSLILIAAWLLALIISISHVLRSKSAASYETEHTDDDIAQRLLRITNEFQVVKKQNEVLRNIILGNTDPKTIQGDHLGSSSDRDKLSPYYDLVERQGRSAQSAFNMPTLEYEESRRRIRNNIQELWYYVNGELNKYKKNLDDFTMHQKGPEIQTAISNVWEHKKALIAEIDHLTSADGYDKWRDKEALDLANLVQRRFKYLQNPSDCSKAKKLICNLNKGCGFGCQIHHVVYCFLVAYGTERTLILKSKDWRYHREGWDSIFQPLSDTCTSVSGEAHAFWPGEPSNQLLFLPIVDNVYPKPKFQPPVVPADIVQRLQVIHGHPAVWWVGQVLRYLMRPQPATSEYLENAKKKLNFQKPIVGIHIRRTDKVGTEAAYHDVDEYMVKVDQYFDQLEEKPDVRRVFIATDDPKVIAATRSRYKKYEIIGDPEVAETASVSKRYSATSLKGIIVDIHLLSMCDFLVCTFSSQVCRVAYELMQTYHTDAHDRFASLDDIYYYGGQSPHPQVAILDHVPKKEGEIELKIGDFVEVYGNHWDGYSKGRNIRTSAKGLFPSFKIKNPVKAEEFPTYANVPLIEVTE